MDAELFRLLHNPKTTSILVMSAVVGELHIQAGTGLPAVELKPNTVYNLLDFNTRISWLTNQSFLRATSSRFMNVVGGVENFGLGTTAVETFPPAEEGFEYPPVQLEATNGTPSTGGPPYSGRFKYIAQNLPTGMLLSEDGLLTGTPTEAGTFVVRITVTNSAYATAVITYTITATAVPNVTVVTPTPSPMVVGQPYSLQIAASGGNNTYTFSVQAGTLPPGLSLNPTTGLISGTPTEEGSYPGIVIRATSFSKFDDTEPFTLGESVENVFTGIAELYTEQDMLDFQAENYTEVIGDMYIILPAASMELVKFDSMLTVTGLLSLGVDEPGGPVEVDLSEAFPNLTSTFRIDLTSTLSGTTIALTDSFNSLTTITESLTLQHISQVTSSFAALSGVGSLSILATTLTNLDFLSALTNITPLEGEDFAVEISANELMTDVSELLDTTIVGGALTQAAFINNSTLPGVAQCDAVINHWISEGFAGSISQQGNGPG
jgi:hypothetical protein